MTISYFPMIIFRGYILVCSVHEYSIFDRVRYVRHRKLNTTQSLSHVESKAFHLIGRENQPYLTDIIRCY